MKEPPLFEDIDALNAAAYVDKETIAEVSSRIDRARVERVVASTFQRFNDKRSATIIAAFAVECPCRHQCFEPQLLHDKSGYAKRPRPPKRFRKDGKESYLEIKDRSKWSDRRGFYRRRTRLNSASDWSRNSWWFAWPYSTQMRYCWKCDHEYLYCIPGYADHQWVSLPPRDDCEDAQCVNCDAVTSDAVFTCGTETPHEPGRGDRSMCRRCGNRILGSSG